MNSAVKLMIVAIVITIIVIVVQYYRTKPVEYTFAPDLVSLSTPTSVVPSDAAAAICNSNDFTLSTYIFVSAVNRTRTLASNEAPLLGVADMFVMNIGPAESSLVLGSGSATETAAAKAARTLQLPTFPQQKWVYLTIVKTGRKFTVMYNKEVVGSKVANFMPVTRGQSLRVGHETIKGTYMGGTYINVRRTVEEVIANHAKTSDTRGNPVRPLFASITAFFSNRKGICPPGVVCDEVLVNPTQLVSWDTPYA